MATEGLKLVKHRPIFQTIQGEGSRVGEPVTFLRLFGCSLSCDWCDTKYSWKPEAENFGGEDVPIPEIVKQLKGASHIVVTGGEPSLQAKKLVELFKAIEAENVLPHITMETNGLHDLSSLFEYVRLFSLAPKSWTWDNAQLAANLLLLFSTGYSGELQVKLVAESTLEFYHSFLHLSNTMARNNIRSGTQKMPNLYLQPETSKGLEFYRKVVQWYRETCPKPLIDALTWNFRIRILPQLHPMLGVE